MVDSLPRRLLQQVGGDSGGAGAGRYYSCYGFWMRAGKD